MKFGRLTVLSEDGRSNDGHVKWLCQCECGNTVSVISRDLRRGQQSCGCYRAIKNREMHITHGKTNTRLFHIWGGMKARCNNPNSPNNNNYGGRGILICEEWMNSFECFYEWAIANGYRDDLTIDRIDVNGNYEPSNCRWATVKQQINNTRVNVYLTHNSKTQSMSMWADELGIPYQLVRDRHKLHPNMSFEELFAPVQEEIKLKYNGKEQSISAWSAELGIPLGTIYSRIYRYGIDKVEKLLNKRNNRRVIPITYKGKTMNLREWADELGISYSVLKNRHYKHPEYTPEQLFGPKMR